MEALYVATPGKTLLKIGLPGAPLLIPAFDLLLGPCGPWPVFNTVPVVKIIPLLIPRLVPAAVNWPIDPPAPVY